MTAAVVGNFTVKIGTNASPQVLTNVEEVLELDSFGASNDLIDVTNFDTTVGEKEFIAGPAEGDEFTVTCNLVGGAATHQNALRDDKGNTRLFEIRFLGTSPNTTWTGSAVLMGWTVNPSISDQDQIEFRFKITGGITEAGG